MFFLLKPTVALQPYQAELGLGSSEERAEAEGLLQKERKFLNAKSVIAV